MLRELQRTTQDLEKIYKLLMRMHGEVGFDVGAVVPEKVLLQVVTCVETGVVYVLDEGDFKGALGLRPDQPWWGDFEFLIDGFFFIAPESRSLANARKFLVAARNTQPRARCPCSCNSCRRLTWPARKYSSSAKASSLVAHSWSGGPNDDLRRL